jgi:outer membrane protein insertion porin family
LGSVRLEPAALPAGVAVREMRLRVGEPYRVRDLARDRDDLLSAFHDAGYPQAEITPEVSFTEDADQAQVVLHVQAGQEVTVDHVVVAGLDVTREEVVRRELRLREGGPLGLGPLLESQRRLGGLGIFERVSLTEIDPESRPARSVVISTQEGPRTSVSPAIGYGERDGLRGSVEVTRRNLFGMDRTLAGFARVSFNGLRLLTTFREPYALGRPQEVFVTAFREEEAREAFSFVRYGALVQGGRTVPRGWSFVFRYTYQRTSSFNIQNPDLVTREFTNSTLAGPSSSIINDTRDDPLDPHRGRFLSADLQLSHALLGGDSFVKTFLQAATYERLHPRVVLALGGRLGLGRTFGDPRLLLPRPDRFYAGGDYSLRGFRLDTVGPTAPDANGVPVATGGNALLLGSAELRVDTGHSFAVAAFSDVGNVYGLASRLTLDDLRYSAGVGLRYRSSLGPVRVDWGYKLNHRPEDQSRYEFHITLGNAF